MQSVRWPCDDERQHRQHRHTAVSPQILERVDVLERSVAVVHMVSRASAARRVAVCTALSASEPRRERCVIPPPHQLAAWIFNPYCVGNVREQASHLCASVTASTSASVVELTCVLWRICMTLLLACDITIAASVDGACCQCGHSGSRCRSIRIDERGVIRVLELRHDGRTLTHGNRNAGGFGGHAS